MSSNGLWADLMQLGDAKLNSVIKSAIDEYYETLFNVASDIYDSCIHDFYDQYTPRVYKRHGNLSGENLYRANNIFDDGNTVNITLNEWSLMPYGKHDKRDIVFEFVLAGLRGGPFPNRLDFPMDWYTTYPNAYSRYGDVWQSSENILQYILDDFCANVVSDTLHIVVNNIAKKI